MITVSFRTWGPGSGDLFFSVHPVSLLPDIPGIQSWVGHHSQGGGLTLWLGMTFNDILVSGQLG